MKKLILPIFAFSMLFIASCSSDDDQKPTPNPSENVDLSAITNAFKSIKVIHDNLGSDAKKTPADLVALYNKDIKKHVATSAQADFTNWITHVKDNADKTATKGNAGKLGKRYLDGNGIELGQIVKKGLIGAFQLNGFNTAMMKSIKATSKEARKATLDEVVTFLLGDISYLNKPKVEKENHGVKSMQYPVYDGNEFGKYLNVVSAKGKYKGIADKVYEGLKKAYTQTDKASEFNATVLEVNKNVTTTVAFRGVHYLTGASGLETTLTDGVAHGVSEGLGFAYSLQFAYKGSESFYLTAEKGKSFTTVNLWGGEATATKILEDSNNIAGMFGFTVAEAK